MIRCLRCATNCDDDLKYCPNCGNNLMTNNSANNIQSNYQIKNKRLEIALLLSIFLPGISYFYLELWYRGILFYLSYVLFFIILGIKSGFYYTYGNTLNVNHISMLILFIYLLVYVFQVIDVIKRTNMINNAQIRF
ncbi:MAG: hypothetical protein IJJ11_01635 [Methanosphaera sp.]|nr:hypothetical protein [Methanosphaera sp.]